MLCTCAKSAHCFKKELTVVLACSGWMVPFCSICPRMGSQGRFGWFGSASMRWYAESIARWVSDTPFVAPTGEAAFAGDAMVSAKGKCREVRASRFPGHADRSPKNPTCS